MLSLMSVACLRWCCDQPVTNLFRMTTALHRLSVKLVHRYGQSPPALPINWFLRPRKEQITDLESVRLCKLRFFPEVFHGFPLPWFLAIAFHSYTGPRSTPAVAASSGACQTKIPPQAAGEHFEVKVRPVSDAHKTQEPWSQRSFPGSVDREGWNLWLKQERSNRPEGIKGLTKTI